MHAVSYIALASYSSSIMDQAFADHLKHSGLSDNTLDILKEEAVVSEKIFKLLHKEHLQLLLPKLPVGQHAVLYSLWQESSDPGFLGK